MITTLSRNKLTNIFEVNSIKVIEVYRQLDSTTFIHCRKGGNNFMIYISEKYHLPVFEDVNSQVIYLSEKIPEKKIDIIKFINKGTDFHICSLSGRDLLFCGTEDKFFKFGEEKKKKKKEKQDPIVKLEEEVSKVIKKKKKKTPFEGTIELVFDPSDPLEIIADNDLEITSRVKKSDHKLEMDRYICLGQFIPVIDLIELFKNIEKLGKLKTFYDLIIENEKNVKELKFNSCISKLTGISERWKSKNEEFIERDKNLDLQILRLERMLSEVDSKNKLFGEISNSLDEIKLKKLRLKDEHFKFLYELDSTLNEVF